MVEIAQTQNFRCHDIESSESYVENNTSSGFINLQKVISICSLVNVRCRFIFYSIINYWSSMGHVWSTIEVRQLWTGLYYLEIMRDFGSKFIFSLQNSDFWSNFRKLIRPRAHTQPLSVRLSIRPSVRLSFCHTCGIKLVASRKRAIFLLRISIQMLLIQSFHAKVFYIFHWLLLHHYIIINILFTFLLNHFLFSHFVLYSLSDFFSILLIFHFDVKNQLYHIIFVFHSMWSLL